MKVIAESVIKPSKPWAFRPDRDEEEELIKRKRPEETKSDLMRRVVRHFLKISH